MWHDVQQSLIMWYKIQDDGYSRALTGLNNIK